MTADQSKGGLADYYGITWERSGATRAIRSIRSIRCTSRPGGSSVTISPTQTRRIEPLFADPHPEYPEMVVGKTSAILVGGVKLFSYPSPIDPAILVRKRDGELVAFSQKCTHLACAVYYSAEHDRLECPCHSGYFSIDTGRVLQGPPPRPLPRIRIEERQGVA